MFPVLMNEARATSARAAGRSIAAERIRIPADAMRVLLVKRVRGLAREADDGERHEETGDHGHEELDEREAARLRTAARARAICRCPRAAHCAWFLAIVAA